MNDLKRGENISLTKISPQLNEIIIAVKWFKKLQDETEFEIDTSAFMLTSANKIRTDADFIFYNQPVSIDNAVILKNQLFKVALNNIHQDINKISFVLTLHDAKQKQQNFGMLEKIIVELFDFSNKQKLVSYTLADAKLETAIILGQLYRHNAEWKFKAIGQGYTDGLDVLARNYGVDVEADSSESAQKSSLESSTADLKNDTHRSDKSNDLKAKKLATHKSEQHSNSSNNKQKNTDFDIHNTDFMTKEDHYEPIVQWFKNKSFVTEINPNAMDTSGFFDEVAIELGDNYDLLKIVSNSIKRRQQNGKDRAYIELSNYSSNEIEQLKKFCQQLYDYSFIAKYFYNARADEKKITLQLQSATKIVNFFNGEWLEWYAFMKIAKFCHNRKINFSCTRNIIISLPDGSKYELDVFCLIDGMPLFIECKSGEYRGFIDKYSRLKKKMLMAKPYFWFLISGETTEQVNGLTAMFDITFINEKMLDEYCEEVFVKKTLNF